MMYRGFFLLGLATALTACGQQSTYRSEAADENQRSADQKRAELEPAVGDYCGSVHLVAPDLDYDVTISLQIVDDNQHSSSSTDPTDTVQIPKLGGDMEFPAIANLGSAAYGTLPDLMAATGGNGTVSFTYGDYTPNTNTITLPFTVSGYTGDYGEVIGTLSGDDFSGKWLSESSKYVGTFDVRRCGGSL